MVPDTWLQSTDGTLFLGQVLMHWRRGSHGKEAWSIKLTYSEPTRPPLATTLCRKRLREQAWAAQTPHIPKKGLSPQLVFPEALGQLLAVEV